jgi:predicted DNA-binding protein (UPF0251 family)
VQVSDAAWTALSVEGVEDVIDQSVRRFAREYEFIEVEDWMQDARILVATRPDLLDCLTGDVELGMLQYRLERDLFDRVRVEREQRKRHTSYEERYDEPVSGSEEYAPRPAAIAIRTEVAAYDRPLVEALMPAVWDEAYCFGIRMENAPDQDMPRGSTNKATGNTLAAHIADIKTGWEKAPLTLKERRALILAYGLDWTVKEIAYNQDCSRQMIERRIENAVGKVVQTLNGKDDLSWLTEDDE